MNLQIERAHFILKNFRIICLTYFVRVVVLQQFREKTEHVTRKANSTQRIKIKLVTDVSKATFNSGKK